MLNPDRAKANDEAYKEFEQELTAKLLKCRECGGAREFVAADAVPEDVRQNLGKSMEVEDFIYCPTCKNYSAQSGWEQFDDLGGGL